MRKTCSYQSILKNTVKAIDLVRIMYIHGGGELHRISQKIQKNLPYNKLDSLKTDTEIVWGVRWFIRDQPL